MSAPVSADAVDALIARDPYLGALGLAAHPHDDEVLVVLPPLERHVGIPDARVMHGGVIAAFLEASAMLHLRSVTGTDVRVVEFTSDFVRPLPLRRTFARTIVVRRGRRFASVRVDAWQEQPDRLSAVGYGRFLVAPA